MPETMVQEYSLDRVNEARDADNMTDLEKKHFPDIERPHSVKAGEPFVVKIRTGKMLEHPNELAHFIMWTELYAGDRFIGRTQFSPQVTSPSACFELSINEGEELTAYTMCNLHGQWKNSVPIRIRD